MNLRHAPTYYKIGYKYALYNMSSLNNGEV